MASPSRKIKNISLALLLSLLGLMGLFHLLLNKPFVQEKIISFFTKKSGVSISVDNLKFSGLTGHFSGSNLKVVVPKAALTLSLDHFKISFDPSKLIFKRIRILDLQAGKIVIVKSNLARATYPKKTPKDPTDIIRSVQVDQAQIDEFQFINPLGTQAKARAITITTGVSIPFRPRNYKVEVGDGSFFSPRFDFVGQKILAEGNLSLEWDKQASRIAPVGKIRFRGNEMMIGFFKKPISSNKTPAWDLSLTPLLEKIYPDGIPSNRGFAYIKNLGSFSQISSRNINASFKLEAFDGQLRGNATWDKTTGAATFNFQTQKSLNWALLPFGRAKIRQSFEKADLAFAGSGTFFNLAKNQLKGDLNVDLNGNVFVPALDKLNLHVSPALNNGILSLPDLTLKLGEGLVRGSGEIDLAEKKFSSRLSGTKFDTQTVVRFFSTLDIPAQADFTGTISGDLKNPDFNISITAPQAGYEKMVLGAFNGLLKISNNVLNLTGTATQEAGRAQVELNVSSLFGAEGQKTDFKFQLDNMEIASIFKTKFFTGILGGNFSMSKLGDNIDGKGEVLAKSIQWIGPKVANLKGSLNLKNKTFTITPISIDWEKASPDILTKTPLVFQFDDLGYSFKGELLPQTSVEGDFKNSEPDVLKMQVKADNASLDFLSHELPGEPHEINLTGLFKIAYAFPLPLNSKIEADIQKFNYQGDNVSLKLSSPSKLLFENQSLNFNQTKILLGSSPLQLGGSLSAESNSNLQIKGALDLPSLVDFQPFITDAFGSLQLDLTVKGPLKAPLLDGVLHFNDDTLSIRGLPGELSKLRGDVSVANNRFNFKGLTGFFDDGPFTLNGWIDWQAPTAIGGADLKLVGKDLNLYKADTWRITTDADVTLKGSASQLTLSGDLQITDALYFKDYALYAFVIKPIGITYEKEEIDFPPILRDMHLALQVRSLGDLIIKNNLADLTLKTNLEVYGTIGQPELKGVIDLVEGEIHMLGINFDSAVGFINFDQAQGSDPLIDISATHQIQNYEVSAKIRGYTSNLRMELESAPALNQNDIISLIAYGQTPDQLAENKRDLFTGRAIASQVMGIIQRPLSKATKLDIVRIETDSFASSNSPSRFSIGKKISDRFALAFVTDLSIDEATRGIAIEFLLLDNLLLKSSTETQGRFRFDLAWRYELY